MLSNISLRTTMVENFRRNTPLLPFRVATYRPELDFSPELEPKEATYYQSQIGILRWMVVELGRVDIITEVSELASQVALPREGHLEAVFRMYSSYLQFKKNSLIVFDPTYPEVDKAQFPKRN